MKKHKWEIIIVLSLLALTVAMHFAHYGLFHDWHHLLIYGFGDLAFLPLEVLIVTYVLHRLLEWREKKAQLSKMNMLIGSFFSELGVDVLRCVASSDNNKSDLSKNVNVHAQWTKKEFAFALKYLNAYEADVDVNIENLSYLKEKFSKEKQFLTGMLQNPVLLEHRSFTDLLWATFHLAEELSYREDLTKSPQKDIDHLKIDVERTYQRLLKQWVSYMDHLKDDYPYLLALAIRLSPFKENIDVVVK